MTVAGATAADWPRVHLTANDESAHARLLTLIRTCGFPLVAEPAGPAGIVVIAAAPTVDEAMAACLPGCGGCGTSGRWLLVADRFSLVGVMRAVRAGAHTMLRTADATSAQLATAVWAAHRGEGRMPHEVLVRLLSGAAPEHAAATVPRQCGTVQPLTPRQQAVLALMAEGLGNADIAQVLCCSEHTIKNVIYDLMARLQVRNRAHAVACAVREGIV